MPTRKVEEYVSVPEVEKETTTVTIIGTTPLIINRVAEKAKRELLVGGTKKNAAERQASLKHDPIAEFRSSPYTLKEDDAPTLIAGMASWFKGAMGTAALDLPGAKKAQIGRLCYVEGEYVPVYGDPKLFMSITRSADINHTPDVRTRCIVPAWMCEITISWVKPLLKLQDIVNLLAAGGITAGVGDWRPQKGSGNYGQFRIASDKDAELITALKHLDRPLQVAALKTPQPYDSETEEMLEWYVAEVKRRGFKIADFNGFAKPDEEAAAD